MIPDRYLSQPDVQELVDKLVGRVGSVAIVEALARTFEKNESDEDTSSWHGRACRAAFREQAALFHELAAKIAKYAGQ